MKNFFVIALLMLRCCEIVAAPVVGFFQVQQQIAPGVFHLVLYGVYDDDVDYVNGGLTVNFPAGLFDSTADVRLLLTIKLKNLSYSSDLLLSPCATSVSISSATIRVNKGLITLPLLAAASECATNDVTVHIRAMGMAPQ